MVHKKIALIIIISILALTLLSVATPQASADPSVTTTFAATGFSGYSSNIIKIDGTSYTVSDLSWRTFKWKPAETHTIQAVSSFRNTDNPSKNYTFSSWSDDSTITSASRTFIVPNKDTLITMNYVLATHVVSFSFTGITYYSSQIVVIDGVTYPLSDFGTRTFSWDNGTVHKVQAVTPIHNTEYLSKTYAFQSWTNGGSDLTGASGTITMPNNDIAITANYASPTHNLNFAVNGLTSYSSSIVKVDGTTYAVSDLSTKIFTWDAGTTHSIQAITPVVNTAYPTETFNFSGWTNGGALTGTSGTYTMPTQDATITLNYIQASAQVTFAASGLGSIPSGVTILTVNGQNYDAYQVSQINSNLDWMITSTHTVTAAPMVTDWSGTRYYFNGWTNGHGLTSNTGTLTVTAGDALVTANYGASQPVSQAQTAITIICNPMDQNRVTSITGLLTSNNAGVTGKTVTLTYFDGANWLPIASATTVENGNYTYAWTVPTNVANGQYPVRATFTADTNYQGCFTTTGSPGNGTNLTVLPESWGSVVALLACFAGALVFFKIRSRRSQTKAD